MAQLVVGLDIGTSAVRAAELDISHSRPVLLTYGQVGLPPGSLVDGEIRDSSAVSRPSRSCGRTASSRARRSSSASPACGPSPGRSIFPSYRTTKSTARCASSPKRSFPFPRTRPSSRLRSWPTTPLPRATRCGGSWSPPPTSIWSTVSSTAVENAGLTVDGVDLISSALVTGRGWPRGIGPTRSHRLGGRRTHRRRGPPERPAPVRAHHRFGRQCHHRRRLGGARHPHARRRRDQAPDRRRSVPQMQRPIGPPRPA